MKKQIGLSLVELMISITLGLLLMAGVVQIFISSKNVFTTQQGMSRIQETGRLAIEFIGRDLRMASYYGCVSAIDLSTNTSNITDTLTSLTGLHSNFSQGLVGFTDVTLPNGASTDLGSSLTVASPSDVLVIRGANERGILINAANGQTTMSGYTPESATVGNCAEGFCLGSVGVISNCERGRFFEVSANPSISSNSLTLTHADSWSLTSTPPTGVDNNYSRGSIFPVHTIVYFVATSSTSTIPSLWQRIDNQTPVELLQGVENMSVRYSSDGNNYHAAASGNTWNAAGINWNTVSSVRIEVLVRGLEQKNLDDAQSYNFAGSTTTPTDKIIRQVFKATFSVRTRSN